MFNCFHFICQRKFLRWKRVYQLVLIAFIYLSCTTLHFIYTSPGSANMYFYYIRSFVYAEQNYYHERHDNSQETIVSYIPAFFEVVTNKTCPEKFPEMDGKVNINMTEISMEDVNKNFSHIIRHGGEWSPHDCIPKWKVAILVPFRNRHEHLPILLRHLLPMLMKQHLQFSIFVINQAGNQLFNRAMLLNVGFVEAMKRTKFDCFIFHDVDHLPENNRNYYGCTGMPRRLREKLDIYGYRLEYPTFFGGVSGVTAQQFKNVNGFSNQFWGWGGEDDDFYLRIKHFGYKVSSPPHNYGKYRSIVSHHHQERQDLGRFALLKHSVERNFVDGLNSLSYKKPKIERHSLFTNISVELRPVKSFYFPISEQS
ncbi:beta-1,4-galactosyltransferase 5-like isoform X1 [Clavelina lepadiformis]|uniref:beta-1,4-galactosyltransferase 5-like isoform X1 n=1 Tax=Clavelina lepadiformis TaxID=159417 RepID=UPI0040438A4B